MKKRVKYSAGKPPEPGELREALPPLPSVQSGPPASMVRTQIYLSRQEHAFVQAEAKRRSEPMAAVIRGFIDEKMSIPEAAWENNPLLDPPADPDFKGHRDGAINHDHYVSGGPKKWVKRGDEWVEAPPLPEDYWTNRASAEAYDRKVDEMT